MRGKESGQRQMSAVSPRLEKLLRNGGVVTRCAPGEIDEVRNKVRIAGGRVTQIHKRLVMAAQCHVSQAAAADGPGKTAAIDALALTTISREASETEKA